MTEKMPEFVAVLIVTIGFIIILFIVVALGIPGAVAERLKYLIKVVWGYVP